MSWSLQLSHGDFALSGAKFATVINEEKLAQDLRCAVLEPMGTDDMHLGYGSLIDGGVTPQGEEVPGLIGHADVRQAAASINAEIQRICRDYQSQQLTRAKTDRAVFNRATLTPGEVLTGLSDIEMVQDEDALSVNVVLQTARGQAVSLDVSLTQR